MGTFSKEDNIYKGNLSNLLEISFADETSGDDTVKVVEWYFPNSDRSQIRTSKEKVFKQVMAGLKSINEGFGTNDKIFKIYYVPTDYESGSIYAALLGYLSQHYHSGNEFQESKAEGS